MNALPIFLRLEGRPALVVGGGVLAAAKVRLLRAAGAEVTVVAPRLGPELADLAADGAIAHRPRGFVAGDAAGLALVFAATGRPELDGRVAEAARAEGVPANVVDSPALSDFIMPAIVDRDPVVIGISTGGAAPLLARRLRGAIEALLPARLGRLARFAAGFRVAARAAYPEAEAQRRFWQRLFDGPIAAAVLGGDEQAARRAALAEINRPAAGDGGRGIVHIVGAGPGDPDLLTLAALRLLQQADVVVYDRLVGPAILDFARRDAERIYVGKAKGRHAKTQAEINALLAAKAAEGRRVVRLKGGDPFVFGRGGEELGHLRAAGVEVAVVPGITAAAGCAAAAGIPLTHRDHAGAVTFVTGQTGDGAPEADWRALAQAGKAGQTIVVYMGVAAAGRVALRLTAAGLDPATPVAVVENGTLPAQRVATGRLDGLAALLIEHGIEAPALIVIGTVAGFAKATVTPAALAAAS